MPEPMSDRLARWRRTADLDARAGQPVGDALREAAAEVERLRERLQESDNLLVAAHLDLCKALDVRHRPLLDVIQHAATVRTERDAAREQVKALRDPNLLRRAIADPGAFVKRQQDDNGNYETVPAWGARAVIAALDGTASDA